MSDSCFKIFKAKCFRKTSIRSRRDSCESIFHNDQKAINEKCFLDKKNNFADSATSNDNDKKVITDNNVDNFDCNYGETEPDVVLRRYHRSYLRSTSTTTSNDALSSDDDDNEENLDILYPLPRVNTHERPLSEEANRQIVDKNNGMWKYQFLVSRTHR
jgi:hypothetical protein